MIRNGRAAPLSSSRRLLRLTGCLSLAFFACRSPQTTLVADDFSDGVLDSMWVVTGDDRGLREADGELVFDYVSCGRGVGYKMDPAQRTLCGDFDVSIDYALVRFESGVYGLFASFGAYALETPLRRAVIERAAADFPYGLAPGAQCYKAWIDDGSAARGDTRWQASDDTHGRFRLQRVGDEIRFYYWRDRWVMLRSDTWSSEPAIVYFWVGSTSWRGPDIEVRFDNLRIVGSECEGYREPGVGERAARVARRVWRGTREIVSDGIARVAAATVARPRWVEWNAASGLKPDEACAFRFCSASSKIQPDLNDGVLRFDTMVAGRTRSLAVYRQVAGLKMPRRFVMEARVRVVAEEHPFWQERNTTVLVQAGQQRGLFLEIGLDEVFVARIEGFRTPTVHVDTNDTPHTYRIEIEGDQVDVYQDDRPIIHTSLEHNTWYADRPVIAFGNPLWFATGVSEWSFVRHNASTLTCAAASAGR